MSWKPTEHPYFPLPTKEKAEAFVREQGADAFKSWLEERETKIELTRKDPFAHGIRLPHWEDADRLVERYDRVLISGGNRSGKTQYMARWCLERMVERERYEVAVFSMTSQSSVRDLQPAFYEWMPIEWKGAKKNSTTNINFSRKNGFTDNVFIAPNGSRCMFFHYSQQGDILEGAELDACCFDELVPWSWVQTAAYRLITRRGKMIITATPVTGFTPTVSDFQSGMKIVETREATLLEPDKVHVRGCPAGHMPYIAECLRKDSAVIFFPTEANPFQPKDEMVRVLKGETQAQKLCRAYGYVERSQAGFFPRFSAAHIISKDKIPTDVTRYMCVDPAGSRMWAMLWCAVDKEGTHYIYRDWPDAQTYGNWGDIGEKPEGVRGQAQKAQGLGLADYKAEIARLEGGEQISERLIDPRAGGTPAQTQDGSETLIDLLGYDPNGLYFQAASGVTLEQGIESINSLLAYNLEEPISVVNQPRLYISEECQQLIACLQNWTAVAGDKNVWKDFCDVLRYLCLHQLTYVDQSSKSRQFTASRAY